MNSRVLVGIAFGLMLGALLAAAGAGGQPNASSGRGGGSDAQSNAGQGEQGELIFVADGSLCVQGPQAAGARRLTYSPATDVAPRWSRTGTQLAFGRWPLHLAWSYVEPHLVVQGAGGRHEFLRVNGVASWSADGTELAVAGYGATHASTRVSLVTVTGARIRSLLEGTSDPDWSPDGELIAFADGYRASSQSRGIGLTRPDGTGTTWLTRGDDAAPAWSPDGSRLAFVRPSAVHRESAVYIVNRDGSGERRLATGRDPAWAQDGTHLVFAHGGDIWSIAADGTGLRALTSGPRVDSEPDWRATRARPVLPRRGCGRKFVGREERGRTGRNERFAGSAGDDLAYGLKGDDVLRGGSGKDVLDAGSGHDRVHSRDGFEDVVSCGPGQDRVVADRLDIVARDCEHLVRAKTVTRGR